MRRLAAIAVAMTLLGALLLVATSQGGDGGNGEETALRCGRNIARIRPSRCVVAGAVGSVATFVYLVRLHWSNWGSLKARARGYVGNPEKEKSNPSSAVTVVVHGRVLCDGKPFYRYLRLGSHGHTRLRLLLSACPD